MKEFTGWEALKGKKIFDGDILESLVLKTKLEVCKVGQDWCVENSKGKLIPFSELTHSMTHEKRLVLNKI